MTDHVWLCAIVLAAAYAWEALAAARGLPLTGCESSERLRDCAVAESLAWAVRCAGPCGAEVDLTAAGGRIEAFVLPGAQLGAAPAAGRVGAGVVWLCGRDAPTARCLGSIRLEPDRSWSLVVIRSAGPAAAVVSGRVTIAPRA